MRLCPKCRNLFMSADRASCTFDGAKLIVPNGDTLRRNVGRFVVDEPIAIGRLGRIFRATDAKKGTGVALKILHGEIAADKKTFARYVERARTMSRIDRACFASIIDAEASADGLAYIARELIDGPNLRDSVRNSGARSARGAANILRQIATALGRVHEAGMLHEDLRSGAVLLAGDREREVVRMLDGGSAVLLNPPLFATEPAYVAPEIVRGEHPTRATDLYLLGVMLYELLIGTPPFTTQAEHLDAPPPSPALDYGGLRALMLALLDKDPKQRPVSCAEVIESIDRLGFSILPAHARSRGSAPSPEPSGADPAAPSAERAPRAWMRPLAVGGALAMIGIAIGVAAIRDPGERARADAPAAAIVEAPLPETERAPEPFAVDAIAGGGSADAPKRRVEETKPAPAAAKTGHDSAESEKRTTIEPPPQGSETARAKAEGAAKRGPTLAAAPQAGPDFSALDAELGRALSDRGLAWDDLAAAAPEPARRWGRWYKKSEEPSPRDIAKTYEALMKAIDSTARTKAQSRAVPAESDSPAKPAEEDTAAAAHDDAEEN
jgi:protein kinase-like protein